MREKFRGGGLNSHGVFKLRAKLVSMGLGINGFGS